MKGTAHLLVETEGSVTVTPVIEDNVRIAAMDIAYAAIAERAGAVIGHKYLPVTMDIEWDRPPSALSKPDKYPGVYVW